MEPKRFLDLQEEDILSNLTIQNRYTPEDANDLLKQLYIFVGKLKAARHSQVPTDEILQRLNGFTDRDCRLIKDWLLKAIQYDDSYVHAYTPLAQEHNRETRMSVYPMKVIAYDRLIALIEGEDNEQVVTPKDTADEVQPTNPLIINENILNSFHGAFNNNTLWKSTDIDTFKNWFRVNPVGRPEFIPKMKGWFCYAVGKIETHFDSEHKPKDINKWFTGIIGKNMYSGLKNSKKSNSAIKKEIDNKLALFK